MKYTQERKHEQAKVGKEKIQRGGLLAQQALFWNIPAVGEGPSVFSGRTVQFPFVANGQQLLWVARETGHVVGGSGNQ